MRLFDSGAARRYTQCSRKQFYHWLDAYGLLERRRQFDPHEKRNFTTAEMKTLAVLRRLAEAGVPPCQQLAHQILDAFEIDDSAEWIVRSAVGVTAFSDPADVARTVLDRSADAGVVQVVSVPSLWT